jgi:membrane-bound lytic murein transglycosylase D
MLKMNSVQKLVSFVLVGLVCLTACLSIGSSDSEKAKNEKPLVSSMTVSPEIPDEVMFCDEKIDLTRYNMHEGFDRELTSFIYFHATTMLQFKRANRYFSIMEPILKANGIPDDLKYLAVIESNMDPRAVSYVNAVGIWQLMPATAKQYGLTVSNEVDERYNLVKATETACKYFKSAYKKYGSWPAVAASYNAGMGRISGELTKQKAESTFNLWLVEETSRYVYRILAIKQIFENPYKYGFVFKAENLYKPIACKEIEVSGNIDDLAAFAAKYDITYADLKQFNLWLRDRKLTTGGKTYKIMIPKPGELYYKKPNTKVHDSRWVID